MEKFIFPDLYCPFPLQVNMHVDVLGDYALEWVMRFNLLQDELSYERFRKSKFYLLAAYTYPYCQLEELKIANDWISWLFILDDQCDMSDLGEQPELLNAFHKRFLEILNGAELMLQDIPLSHALNNLRERIVQKATAKWFRYFVRTVEEYFQGCVLEAANRLQGIVPKIGTYSTLRSLTGAVDSTTELIEFCNYLILPDFLRLHDIVQKLKMMTNNIICWCNDIVSVSKEMARGDVHNLVLVIHHQQQIPLKKAIERAAEIHNQEIRAMINLEASIPSFGKEVDVELAKYISGMHAWIRGNFDWGCRSARYQTLETLALVKS